MALLDDNHDHLLPGLREGRVEVWREAFTLLWPCAFKAAHRVLEDRRDAEECAAHALQAIHRRGPGVMREFSELTGLAIVIARRRAASTLRTRLAEKRGGSGRPPLSLDLIPPDSPLLKQPQLEASLAMDMSNLLDQLPDDERRLLEGFFWEGLTSKELAERHKSNANTVRSKVLRAVRTLRGLLGRENSTDLAPEQ